MKNRKIVLMGFGLGGNSCEFEGGNAHGSWYLKPEDLERYVDRDDGYGYKSEDLEGAILLDKLPALECSHGYAISSPMIDVSLERGKVDRFADIGLDSGSSMVLQAFAQGDGTQRGLAAMAIEALANPQFGGLDRVALDLYVQWWHARGARVGRFVGGRVLWE